MKKSHSSRLKLTLTQVYETVIVIVVSNLLKRYLKAIAPAGHQLIHERCDESKGVFPEGGQEKLRSGFQRCNHLIFLTSAYESRWPVYQIYQKQCAAIVLTIAELDKGAGKAEKESNLCGICALLGI